MIEYRNENEVVVHSLGRSGSHAIINWIASMFKEPVYFFNNCPLDDPFKAPLRYWKRVRGRPIKKFFIQLPRGMKVSSEKRTKYRNIHKYCLMYSYEHKDIRTLKDGEFIEDRDLVGESKNRYNVLILRDLFNWLASSLMHKQKKHPSSRLIKKTKIFELWRPYAEEFIGKTNYLKTKKICISFDRWFIDEDYRKRIANLLDLEYSDFTLDYVGSSSNFDNMEYEGKAQEMDALGRWKILQDSSNYHEILEPEAIKLSHEIFGIND